MLLFFSGWGLGIRPQPNLRANTVLLSSRHPIYLEMLCFGCLEIDWLVNTECLLYLGSIVGICWVCTSCQTEHLNIARSLTDICNGMPGAHQGHQLYEVFLHVMSTEHDTVERFFSRLLFYEVKLRLEHKCHLPIRLLHLLLLNVLLLNLLLNLSRGPPFPKGDSPSRG